MACLPYSPLCQGLLTGSFAAENNFSDKDVRNANPKLQGKQLIQYLEIVDKLQTFAQSIDKPLAQVALNWLIADDVIPSVFCGHANPKEVEQNVKTTEWELSEDMLNEISKILAPYKRAGLV